MSLYAHIASTALCPGKTVHDAYYYSVTKGKKLSKKRPTEETLQAIAEKIKNYLQQGYYPIEPDINQDACRYCAYDLVCRKGVRQVSRARFRLCVYVYTVEGASEILHYVRLGQFFVKMRKS